MNRTPRIVVSVLAAVIVIVLVAWFFIEYRERPRLVLGATTTSTPSGLDDLIVVDTPGMGGVVSSPLHIAGKARGSWYFEASFPVKIFDANGMELASAPAQAQGEWMTAAFVPFSLSLHFVTSTTETGTLVFKKDNPSGLPGQDNERIVPIRFAATRVVQQSDTMQVKLYYYNPALDQGPGGIQCSAKGLVAVTRTIPKTVTPLKSVIELLLQGKISEAEKKQGVTTEFPLAGLVLKSAAITGGIASLTFDDPQNKTSGGACRAGILWQQIQATALQFATVKSVRFIPEELFQP